MISSIPYGIASISVPIIGSFLRGKSDKVYEDSMLGGLLLIFSVHMFYVIMLEHTVNRVLPVFPVAFFGLGHAIFTTLIPTTAPKVIDNQDQLSIAFSIMKVAEGGCITFFTQLAGTVRQ